MNESVKKIFVVLIVVVVLVIIGALVLNLLLPNAATALVDAIEDMIYNATKMSFDFNGNGNGGSTTTGAYSATVNQNNNDPAANGAGVDGFN